MHLNIYMNKIFKKTNIYTLVLNWENHILSHNFVTAPAKVNPARLKK